MDKETLHKEIDLIQGIINRMANNSFLLKGWTVTLVVAVLALTKDLLAGENLIYSLLILLIPLVAFWYLDAFFLHTERCYRKLYEWVTTERPKGNTEFLYDLNYTRFKNVVPPFCKTMYSKTLRIFYGSIIGIIVVALIVLVIPDCMKLLGCCNYGCAS